MRLSVLLLATVALASLALVSADVYLHHPRGSNDRVRRRSTNTATAQHHTAHWISFRVIGARNGDAAHG
jgi:hypothetical protein